MGSGFPEYAFARLPPETKKPDELTKIALAGRASRLAHHLARELHNFNQRLDQENEVAIQLVTFGNIDLHVRGVSYQEPSLIYFECEDGDGNKYVLTQHVSQINFLMIAARRKEPDQPRPQIGFQVRDADEVSNAR